MPRYSLTPRTPEQQSLQQEGEANRAINQQAQDQDFIAKQQREAREQEASIKKAQSESAAAARAQIANAKRAGVKTAVNDAGGESIQTHEDGAPVYESGFQGEVQHTPDGPFASYRDSRGTGYKVPTSAINEVKDSAGAPFYEFKTPEGQTVRQPVGTKPLFKTDPLTGKRYTEAADATGSFIQTPVGVDKAVAATAAVERRKAALKAQDDAIDFKSKDLTLQKQQIDYQLEPIKAKLSEATSALKKFDTGTQYRQGDDGLYSVDEKLGDFKVTSPEDISKANNWLKSKKAAQDALNAVKAEHDPLDKRSYDLKGQHLALGRESFAASQRAAKEIAAIEQAAKVGLDVSDPLWKEQLRTKTQTPLMLKVFNDGHLTERNPELAAAAEEAAFPETNKLLESLGRPPQLMPAGQGVLSPESKKAGVKAVATPRVPSLLERIKTGDSPNEVKDAKTTAMTALGIINPEKWQVNDNGNGSSALIDDSGTHIGDIDSNNRMIRLFPAPFGPEAAANQQRMANANENGLPIYLMGGEQPMTKVELRDYVEKGIHASMSATTPEEKDAKLAEVGMSPDDIRKNVLAGRISFQEGRMLADTLHGIEQKDVTPEAMMTDWKKFLASDSPEARNFVSSDNAGRMASANKWMDKWAYGASNNIIVDRAVLEDARAKLVGSVDDRSGAGKALDWTGHAAKNAIVSMGGMIAGTVGNSLALLQTGITKATGLGGLTTREQQALDVFWNQSKDVWDRNTKASGIAHRFFGEGEMRGIIDEIHSWARTAGSGDTLPEDLDKKLADAVYDGYWQMQPEGAKELGTNRDSFSINKTPALRGMLNRYLQTGDPSVFEGIKSMLVMTGNDRKTAMQAMDYVSRPRVASGSTVIERGDKIGIALDDAKANQVMSLSKAMDLAAESGDKKRFDLLSKQAGAVLGLKDPAHVMEAMGLMTSEESDDPDSWTGMFRGAYTADIAEMATEIGSDVVMALGTASLVGAPEAVMLKGAQIAAKGAKVSAMQALKNGVIRTFAAAGDNVAARSVSFSKLRKGIEEAGTAFKKAGIVTETLGKPLTLAQKARNVAVTAAKVGGAGAPLEMVEEGAHSLLDAGPNAAKLTEDSLAGMVGGMTIGASMVGIGTVYNSTVATGKQKRVFNEMRDEQIKAVNEQFKDKPGFAPLTPEHYDAWQAIQANPIHNQNVAEFNDATNEYTKAAIQHQMAPSTMLENVNARLAELEGAETTTESSAEMASLVAKRDELMADPASAVDTTSGPLVVALSRHQQARDNIAGTSAQSFAAMDELRALPENERALYTAAAKAVAGSRTFTEAEAKALIGQSGENAVAFSQAVAMPEGVAGPVQVKTTGAPAVARDGGKRMVIPEGARIIVPPALINSLAAKAPSMAMMIGASAESTRAAKENQAKAPQESQQAAQPVAEDLGRKATEADVKTVVDKIINDTITANPNLAQRVRFEPNLDEKNKSGLSANTDDATISVDMEKLVGDLTAMVGQGKTTLGRLQERMQMALNEEVIHIANVQAAREQWKQSGDKRSFQEWRNEHYSLIWNNEFTDAMRAKVLKTYPSLKALKKDLATGKMVPMVEDWLKAFEGLRMLQQLKETGSITEMVRQHVQAVLDFLKTILDSLTPVLKQEMEMMQAILDEFRAGKKAEAQAGVKPETDLRKMDKKTRQAWAAAQPTPVLPDQPSDYFITEGAQMVDVSALIPLRPPVDQKKSVKAAMSYAKAAADGLMDKRKPISVRDNGDGTFSVLDGNATLGMAQTAGWAQLPVTVLHKNVSPELRAAVDEAALVDADYLHAIDGNWRGNWKINETGRSVRTMDGKIGEIIALNETGDKMLTVMFPDGSTLKATAKDLMVKLTPEEIELEPHFVRRVAAYTEILDSYNAKLKSVAKGLGEEVAYGITAPLKGAPRALEKAAQALKKERLRFASNQIDKAPSAEEMIASMHDIMRGSILVDSQTQVMGANAAILRAFAPSAALKETRNDGVQSWVTDDGSVTIIIDDRFSKPTPAGYSDVQMKIEVAPGMFAEMQVHIPEMLLAKEGVKGVEEMKIPAKWFESVNIEGFDTAKSGHVLFEEYRAFEKDDRTTPRKLQLEEEMADLYRRAKEAHGLRINPSASSLEMARTNGSSPVSNGTPGTSNLPSGPSTQNLPSSITDGLPSSEKNLAEGENSSGSGVAFTTDDTAGKKNNQAQDLSPVAKNGLSKLSPKSREQIIPAIFRQSQNHAALTRIIDAAPVEVIDWVGGRSSMAQAMFTEGFADVLDTVRRFGTDSASADIEAWMAAINDDAMAAAGDVALNAQSASGAIGTIDSEGNPVVVKVKDLSTAKHADHREITATGNDDGTRDFRFNADNGTVYWWSPASVTSSEKQKLKDYLEAEGFAVVGNKNVRDEFTRAHGALNAQSAVDPTDPGHIRNATYIPKRRLNRNEQTPLAAAFYNTNSTRARAGQIIRSFERDWKPFFTYIDDLATRQERENALDKIINKFALSDKPESKALWEAYARLEPDELVPQDTERVKEAKELLPYMENLSVSFLNAQSASDPLRIADMQDQFHYLDKVAQENGLQNPDELALQKPDVFNRAASEWRQERGVLNAQSAVEDPTRNELVTSGELAFAPAEWRNGRLVVSTRTPSDVKRSVEDRVLITNLDELNNPEATKRFAGAVASYPQVSAEASKSGDANKVIRSLIDSIKSNLRFLYGEFNKLDGGLVERARLWYAGANRIAHRLASDFNIKLEQSSAIIAVFSPQRDWFQNVSQANRALSIIKEVESDKSITFSSEYADHYLSRTREALKNEKSAVVKKSGIDFFNDKVEKKVAEANKNISSMLDKNWASMSIGERAIFVRMFDEINNTESYPTISPEGDFGPPALNASGTESKNAWGSYATIENAISIYYDGSAENISAMLGDMHKVRSFFNNINNPFDAQGFATIDTHANAASLLEPLGGSSPQVAASLGGAPKIASLGISGTYVIYHQAHKELAAELSEEMGQELLPRELQSITWEAVRLLFTNKSKPIKLEINSLWESFHKGNINQDELQQRILAIAGGIPAPVWASIPARTASKQGAILTDTDGARLTGISFGRRSDHVKAEKLPGKTTRKPRGVPSSGVSLNAQGAVSATVAPLRRDNLSELTASGLGQRAGAEAFQQLQKTVSDVAGAFGVGIRKRQPVIGGWVEGGSMSLEVPENIDFNTNDIGVVEEMAAVIAASAPELQNAVMVWKNEKAGKDVLLSFVVNGPQEAMAVAKDFEQAKVNGFSYDPTAQKFSLVLAGISEEDLNHVHEYIRDQTTAGHIKSGGGVETRSGTARLIWDSEYRGNLEKARGRADRLGGERATAIREVVDRAEQRIAEYEQSQKPSDTLNAQSASDVKEVINSRFASLAKEIGVELRPNIKVPIARYGFNRYTSGQVDKRSRDAAIEFNSYSMLKRSDEEIVEVMREELVHAIEDKVLLEDALKKYDKSDPYILTGKYYRDFYENIYNLMSPEEIADTKLAYVTHGNSKFVIGAEFSRMMTSASYYGTTSEQVRRKKATKMTKAMAAIKRMIQRAASYLEKLSKGDSESAKQAKRVHQSALKMLARIDPKESDALNSQSASQPAADYIDPVMRVALEGLPPTWRDALERSLKGESIESIAKRMFIPEIAVGNLLRRAEGRLNVLMRAANNSLIPKKGEDGGVRLDGGRPDLAFGAVPQFAAVDQSREAPEKVTHAAMQELARRMFDVDPEAAKKMVTRWMDSNGLVRVTDGMPAGIKNILDEAEARLAGDMLMTAAAKLLVNREILSGGDPIQTARLIHAYRNIGTEQARALNMRYDPFLTPEERHVHFITESVLTPPESVRNEMEANPSNRDKILAKWAIRTEALKERLKGQGFDIDLTFKLFREEQEARENAIPIEVRVPLTAATVETRAVVRSLLQGDSVEEAATLAGVAVDMVAKLYNDFRATLNRIGSAAASGAKGQMLSASAAADFATMAGVPEIDFSRVGPQQRGLVSNGKVAAIARVVAKRKASGAFNLQSPTPVAQIIGQASADKANWFDKTSEYWRSMILSGPMTHVVNSSSGITFGIYDGMLKKAASATLNSIAQMFGVKNNATTLADLPALFGATKGALSQAYIDAIATWKPEQDNFDEIALAITTKKSRGRVGGDAFSPAIGEGWFHGAISKVIPGYHFGKVVRAPSFRLMMLADVMIKSFFARIEVASQAHQIARTEGLSGQAMASRIAELMKPGSLAWVRGLAQAKKITFQTKIGEGSSAIDSVDGAAKLINKAKSGHHGWLAKGVSHFVVPFVNTPTNIFKVGATMSPLGTFLAIVDAGRALNQRAKGNVEEANRLYSASRALDDIVNQTVAWGVVIAISQLIRPDDDDDKLPFITGTMQWKSTSKGERDIAYKVAPPQSIRIGDRWYSYARLDPFATMLASIVDSMTVVNSDKPADEKWATLAGQAANNLKDKTFLQGLSDLFNAIQDPGRFGSKWATNIATGFVPNFVRQPLRAIDPNIRDTSTPKDWGFWETIQHRIGASIIPDMNIPAVDVWGNTKTKNTGSGPLTDIPLRLLSPVQSVSVKDADPLDVLLLNYNRTHEDEPFAATAPDRTVDRTINGVQYRVNLSDSEYNAMLREAGKAIRSTIGSKFDDAKALAERDVEWIDKLVKTVHGDYRDKYFKINRDKAIVRK
jgi:hypothetical protein